MIKKIINFFLKFQFVRFAIIGVMNTGLDFGVLNLLIFATGVREGLSLALLNSISFSVATANSYLWNKYWTFKDKDAVRVAEIGQFLTVSLIGLGINSSIVYLISTFVDPILGLSPAMWVNASKVVATGIALFWNFLGYKFIVFKK
jgi:putative flippase GtrA